MIETSLEPTTTAPSAQTLRPDVFHEALLESRKRWRDLVGLAADLAFETDANGCFVLVAPETALGWPGGALVGQPSQLLVIDGKTGIVFNPFCPQTELRRHQCWIRGFGGGLVMMSFSVMPLHDDAGRLIGARGIGIDVTDSDAASSDITNRVRRGEMLDHILAQIGNETDANRKVGAALQTLVHALGAEGAAVIGTVSASASTAILHECGPGASATLTAAAELIRQQRTEPGQTASLDGRYVLAVGCHTRLAADAGLAVWHAPSERPWTREDTILVGSAVRIIRMILEAQALEQDLARQARTDPLTGLLNRRAFLDTVGRDIARLDRESASGTLLFVDMDGFKAINDRLGHAVGDQMLAHFADMLRKLVRPSDSLARFGGDEFAVWLSGADYLTAAERADYLCKNVAADMQALIPDIPAGLSVSIGIVTRSVASRETIEDLTRRADMAMYEVKRAGRNHWRVALVDGN